MSVNFNRKFPHNEINFPSFNYPPMPERNLEFFKNLIKYPLRLRGMFFQYVSHYSCVDAWRLKANYIERGF